MSVRGVIDGHAGAVAFLKSRSLVEVSSSVAEIGLAPLFSGPFGSVVVVRSFVGADAHQRYHRIAFPVGRYLPYPVAVGRSVHERERICFGIVGGLVDLERAFGYLQQGVAGDVPEQQTVDVDGVVVQPVGQLVVGVPCRIGEVDAALAVGGILGVGSCSGRLHYLIRTLLDGDIVVGVGQRQPGYRRMPLYAAPAQIYVPGSSDRMNGDG